MSAANLLVQPYQNLDQMEFDGHRFKEPTNKGFSLVELLVVIGIAAVLAALLLTGLSQAKARGRRIQCVNNVRQLGIALQGYVTENGAYPLAIDPGHGEAWMALLQHGQLSGKALSVKSYPYAEGVWKCPAANKPSDWPERRGYNSYGYNWDGMSGPSDTHSLGLGGHFVWSGARLPAPAVRESEVASPSDMMAIGDGFIGGDDGLVEDGTLMLGRTSVNDYDGSTKRAHARHQSKANVVCCDGHVESPTLLFLFRDTNGAALARWNRDHLPHAELLP